MKRAFPPFILLALSTFCFVFLPLNGHAQTSTDDKKLIAQEKEACTRNLKIIYEAIRAYRKDHKDIPYWLSDLFPNYITDPNVLICPECKRTGEAEISPLADPHLPNSYLYEFCPVVMGTNELPNVRGKTRRELKRRQMGLVGSIVPLVRCKHHGTVLNLAFDGRIYESPDDWKLLVTNEIDIRELTPPAIFRDAVPKQGPRGLFFLQRSQKAKPAQVDLTDYYNATFTQSWLGASNSDLSSLPMGLEKFADVEFDVRGLIQLTGKSNLVKRFPSQIKGIPIKQKCQRLIFLHAVAFGNHAHDGTQIGSYIVHYAANKMQLEIPIVYGRDVRDWHFVADEKPGEEGLTVAWTGTNHVGKAASSGHVVRLFKTSWENLAPNVEIDSIDFVSAQAAPAPFLVAITAE